MITLCDLMQLQAEGLVDAAYDAWLASDHCGTVSYSDLVPEGPDDSCADDLEHDLKSWFHEWVIELEDEDEVYAEGFTLHEQNRLHGLADSFVYACIDGIECQNDMELTYRSLPR